jgi:threonylcarbamoyladenosine tRNA methylthiotransferase MtaB
MFENTLSLVDEAELVYLHVFPFSPRKGTPAARMPQLPRSIIRERASLLRARGARTLERHLARLTGSEQDVLVEKPEFGRTPSFAPVRLARPRVAGEMERVTIGGQDGTSLIEGSVSVRIRDQSGDVYAFA